MLFHWLNKEILWMYLLILLSLLSAARGQIVWAEDNCNTENTDPRVVLGEPTDAICCNATKTEKGIPIGVDALMCASKEDEALCEYLANTLVDLGEALPNAPEGFRLDPARNMHADRSCLALDQLPDALFFAPGVPDPFWRCVYYIALIS